MKPHVIKNVVIVATIGLLMTGAILVIFVLLPEKELENRLADGTYRGYYIWCEETDETVTETETWVNGSSTYVYIVFRCTATKPGETHAYDLNLHLNRASWLYTHWASCNNDIEELQGDLIIDASEYDDVVVSTIRCVLADDNS